MSECLICSRDHRDSYACDSCVTSLVRDLKSLAWLAGQLTVTRTRQARVAGQGGGTGTPLGFHVGAATAYDALRARLAYWVSIWTGKKPQLGSAADCARWLAGQNLRHLVQVDQLAEDVLVHQNIALAVINPLPDEQTYGICGAEQQDGEPCPAYLYGPADASYVRCRRCKNQHDTRDRRDDLARRLKVLYLRPATLARLLPRLIDRPVSASNIVNWSREGKPIKTRTDDKGFTLYHCDDVIAVAVQTPKRNREKAS